MNLKDAEQEFEQAHDTRNSVAYDRDSMEPEEEFDGETIPGPTFATVSKMRHETLEQEVIAAIANAEDVLGDADQSAYAIAQAMIANAKATMYLAAVVQANGGF